MYQASAPMNICILAVAIVYRFINSDCNAPYVMGEFARVKERRGLPDSLRVGAASDLDIEHQIGLGQGLTGQYISGLEPLAAERSEERGVGKEGDSTVRYGGWPSDKKKKKRKQTKQ